MPLSWDIDIILDLEATCEENVPWREYGSEVIEIGAVSKEGDEACFMIKPVKNPILSEFCKKLTTITQAQVEAEDALLFVEALDAFKGWAEFVSEKPAAQIIWGSWGFYDLNILEENCRTHGIQLPFDRLNHRNVKLEVLPMIGLKSGGIDQALKKLGILFEGTHHRGIDDARMIKRARDAAYALPK